MDETTKLTAEEQQRLNAQGKMDDDDTTPASGDDTAPAPGNDAQKPKSKYNAAATYAATDASVQAAEAQANQQIQQMLANAKPTPSALLTAQPTTSTSTQNPIYDMIFSKTNQPAETVQPPSVPAVAQPLPPAQTPGVAMSDKRMKTNVKSADKNIQDFLSKLSPSDMFNRMK